ncbi:MAG: ABC transporter [Cytophagaceae bacterium SCN 52-12]|nr:MAG: ABC transporter [Cytophagaceae bacterium SCN 52-12]
MIEANGISYSVRGRRLLEEVSVTLKTGRLVAVAGPNGAGKSTLLKMLTRELLPEKGTVKLDGRNMTAYTYLDLARKRAVLTQQNKLSLPFEVQEVVMMGRYPFHKNAPEERDYEIVTECLRNVGMLSFARRIFTTLSGGEQQRVQLAKSLAQIWGTEKAFLFLDEPTNGMDLLHQYHALDIARQLADRGAGVVAVLHDLNMTLQYADEVLLMQNGRVKMSGTPAEVLTAANIEDVFSVPVRLMNLPGSEGNIIVPASRF